MKSAVSSLSSELIEVLITLFLPGWIASVPYVILFHSNKAVAEKIVAADNLFFLSVNAFFFVLFLGLICEMFGAWLESDYDEEYVVEQKMNKEEPNHIEEWHRYLRERSDAPVIGHGYVRKVLLRFKFELAAYFGLTIAIVGWAGVLVELPALHFFTSIVIIVSLCLMLYLKSESRYSHRLLCRMRSEILKAKI